VISPLFRSLQLKQIHQSHLSHWIYIIVKYVIIMVNAHSYLLYFCLLNENYVFTVLCEPSHSKHLSCISTVCASENMQWVLSNKHDSLAAQSHCDWLDPHHLLSRQKRIRNHPRNMMKQIIKHENSRKTFTCSQ